MNLLVFSRARLRNMCLETYLYAAITLATKPGIRACLNFEVQALEARKNVMSHPVQKWYQTLSMILWNNPVQAPQA